MADTDFSKFVPGFDFLQGLMKNAGAAIPGFNQWVAPTLDPQELDKRIDELRTVQFWLENNARMLTATIQALEVQRMTLSTLHAMNVPMADLKDALKTPVPPPFPGASSPSSPSPSPSPSSAPAPASKAATAAPSSSPAAEPASKAEPAEDAAEPAKAPAAPGAKPAGADPMQWWNALTRQFTQVAANAMKSAQTAASVATAASTAAASSAAPSGRPAATRSSAAKGSTKASTDRAPRTAAKPAAKAAPARKTTASKRKTP